MFKPSLTAKYGTSVNLKLPVPRTFIPHYALLSFHPRKNTTSPSVATTTPVKKDCVSSPLQVSHCKVFNFPLCVLLFFSAALINSSFVEIQSSPSTQVDVPLHGRVLWTLVIPVIRTARFAHRLSHYNHLRPMFLDTIPPPLHENREEVPAARRVYSVELTSVRRHSAVVSSVVPYLLSFSTSID